MLSLWLIPVGVNLDHLATIVCICQVSSLQNYSFFPFPYFLEGRYYKQPTTKEWGALESCMGDLSALPHLLIYSIIYSYQYGLMDIISYLGSQVNTPLFYYSNCSSFGHWKLFHVAPVSCWHTPIILVFNYFFCFFSTSLLLVLQEAPGSSCIFPASVWESVISPKSPSSLPWRMVF